MSNPTFSGPAPRPATPACIPGCTTAHAPGDEFWPCFAPVGTITVPSQRTGSYATVTVEVVRDVDLDGTLHQRGVQMVTSEGLGVLPAAAIREYAWLLLAAADREERTS